MRKQREEESGGSGAAADPLAALEKAPTPSHPLTSPHPLTPACRLLFHLAECALSVAACPRPWLLARQDVEEAARLARTAAALNAPNALEAHALEVRARAALRRFRSQQQQQH